MRGYILKEKNSPAVYLLSGSTYPECHLLRYDPADLGEAFAFTADETGFIGIKSGYQNEERAQIESLVMDGIQFLVEYAAGVVKGTIGGA